MRAKPTEAIASLSLPALHQLPQDVATTFLDGDGKIPSRRPSKASSVINRSVQPVVSIGSTLVNVTPSEILFTEYEPGQSYTAYLSILNTSKSILNVSLHPFRTKHFKINKRNLKINKIAPGISVQVEVHFTSPLGDAAKEQTKDKDQSVIDNNNRIFSDELCLIVNNNAEKVCIQSRAFPRVPTLVMEESINFGLVLSNPNNHFVSYTDSHSNSDIGRVFHIHNQSNKPVKCAIALQSNSAFQVSSLSFTIGPNGTKSSSLPSTYELLVALSKSVATLGHIEESMVVKIDSMDISDKEDAFSQQYNSSMTTTVALSVDIIKQTLQLCPTENTTLESLQEIDFGSIYFAQKKQFFCRLLNNSNRAVRWVITHAGESTPAVPGKGKFSVLNEASEVEEARTAVSVQPSEGALDPKGIALLSFTFSPQLKRITHGFHASGVTEQPRMYQVPFQIRVITSTGSYNLRRDPPIDIVFKGKSYPFLASLSQKQVNFPMTFFGSESIANVTLTNGSDTLPFVYKVFPLAHFKVVPCKGSIPPRGTMDLQLIFKPNQMGDFKSKAIFHFLPDSNCNVLASKEELILLGKCILPQKQLGAIDQRTVSALSGKSHDLTQLAKPLRDEFRSLRIDAGPLLKYTLLHSENVDELREVRKNVKANRLKYESFIRRKKETKLKSLKKRIFGDDGVEVNLEEMFLIDRTDLLDAETGIFMPEPVMIGRTLGALKQSTAKKQKDTLSIKTKEDHSLRELFEKVKDNKDFRVPKPPDSSLSSSSSDAPLTAFDLVNIFTGYRQIDFGEVSVHSSNLWALNFLNATPSSSLIHISIVREDEDDELMITPTEIYVNPRDINGFEVKFVSHEEGYTHKKIAYVVNGRYKYQIPVQARVLPVDLRLLEERVDFSLSIAKTDDAKQLITGGQASKIHIYNPGNYPAKFKWPILVSSSDISAQTRQKGRIELSQYEGVVEAKATLELVVTFLPGTSTVIEETLQMRVLDPWYESDYQIKCTSLTVKAEITATKFSLVAPLKQGVLDFGFLSVGRQHLKHFKNAEILSWKEKSGTKTVKLRNQGSCHAVFTAELVGNAEIVFEPHYGILPIDSVVELNIAVAPTSPGVVDDVIVFSVVGSSKATKIPVHYEAKQPEVDLLYSDCENMSDTILNSWSCGSVDLKNIGGIVCELIVDLTKHPEFFLSLEEPNEYTMFSGERGGTEGHDVADGKGSNSIIPSETGGKVYLLDLDAGESVKLYLIYRPKCIASHGFNLPLTTIGLSKAFVIPVKASCIESPISISKHEINFRNRIVYQDGSSYAANLVKNVGKETFEIRNTTKKKLLWWFDLTDLEQYDAFSIEPADGMLQPFGSTEISVTFQPETIGHCHCVIPLHVERLGPKAPFSLRIQGTGVNPSLTFDPPEVFLPVGPLGYMSTTSFSILNYGCDRTEVGFTIPEELRKVSLEFIFPEGRLLKSKGERLKVVVKFSSHRPFSFTTKIEIKDSHKRSFYLPIHGTIDNSILTSCFFLESHKDKYSLSASGESGPIKFVPASDIDVQESQKRFFFYLL
jgi:hypothetical protein